MFPWHYILGFAAVQFRRLKSFHYLFTSLSERVTFLCWYRLNCHKAAMRSLRMARNHAASEHERLVYEGWVLYDTGYREEAIAKAEESISIQRSFEAYFLKAYILSETTTDTESSFYVIQLLEEALRCPSDGLRKGQVSIIFYCNVIPPSFTQTHCSSFCLCRPWVI